MPARSSTMNRVEEQPHARARRLIDSSLVWDNHACMPMRPEDQSFLPQLERCRAAGVHVVSINVGGGPLDLAHHLRMLASFRQWFSQHSDRYVLARTAADIDHAREEGKLAIVFDVEGMAPFDNGDHGLVQLFYDLGVRWMLVAYNRRNAAGGGCLDEADSGLSAHGRMLLAEMKRVGMVVCCSHTGHRTALDVMAHADNPVIFSHSNPSAIHRHYRNIPDELIKACAATGGVVGVNGIGVFLGENDDRPQTVFMHIDHMVQLVGAEHVGLALDYMFDQGEIALIKSMPSIIPAEPSLTHQAPKMVPPEAIPAIVEEMASHGYSDSAIAAILGGNWLRIARQVWR
jgi:membrane dipeptidase